MLHQGFTKSSRLLKSKDFSEVFKHPDQRVSNQHLLFLIHRTDISCSRLGIVVAKKNVRKAVQRNRVKRIIREVFRTTEIEIGTIDLVILARKNIDSLSNQQIQLQLEKLFRELTKKLGIKREKLIN